MVKRLLILIGIAAGVAAVGCDRQEARKAGNDTQAAAQNAGAVIDKGLNQLGSAANQGIRDVNQAAVEAKPHVQAAATQATRDLGNMAQQAGHLADRAGEKIHSTLAPATQPAR